MMKLLIAIVGLLVIPACKPPKCLQGMKASVKLHGTMNDGNNDFEIKDCTLLVHPSAPLEVSYSLAK